MRTKEIRTTNRRRSATCRRPKTSTNTSPFRPRSRPAQARHIIGVQGNLWTEYIDTPDYLFYMLLPRMLSLSEIAWSDPRPRIWSAFSARMGTQFPWLARHGYNFKFRIRNSASERHQICASPTFRRACGPSKAEVEAAQTNVVIATIVPGGVIHYTIDGTVPSAGFSRLRRTHHRDARAESARRYSSHRNDAVAPHEHGKRTRAARASRTLDDGLPARPSSRWRSTCSRRPRGGPGDPCTACYLSATKSSTEDAPNWCASANGGAPSALIRTPSREQVRRRGV